MGGRVPDGRSMNIYGETDLFVVEVEDVAEQEPPTEHDVEMTLGEAIRFQWATMALRRYKPWLS